jgi:hypothetical protein
MYRHVGGGKGQEFGWEDGWRERENARGWDQGSDTEAHPLDCGSDDARLPRHSLKAPRLAHVPCVLVRFAHAPTLQALVLLPVVLAQARSPTLPADVLPLAVRAQARSPTLPAAALPLAVRAQARSPTLQAKMLLPVVRALESNAH